MPNVPSLSYTTNANFKDYIKVEVALIKEYYELSEKSKYFEKLKVDND